MRVKQARLARQVAKQNQVFAQHTNIFRRGCVIPLSPMNPTTTETKLMQMTNIKSRTETLKFLNMEMTFTTYRVILAFGLTVLMDLIKNRRLSD
jgi:hypothetical protein